MPRVMVGRWRLRRESNSDSITTLAEEPDVDNKYPDENDDGDGLKE
jgi:hypothetical protein